MPRQSDGTQKSDNGSESEVLCVHFHRVHKKYNSQVESTWLADALKCRPSVITLEEIQEVSVIM